MQLFISLQPDCRSLNTSPSLLPVWGLVSQLDGEWGMPTNSWKHVQMSQWRQPWPSPLTMHINQTVENTGVKVEEEREATLSTSLSLVCWLYADSILLQYINENVTSRPFVMLFRWFCDPGETCPARDGWGRCDSELQKEEYSFNLPADFYKDGLHCSNSSGEMTIHR